MESIERTVAKSLLDIKAVLLSPEKPFRWASGWLSPIYCDNRRILSYPELREHVCRWMADNIITRSPDVEVIAGVATGAIAHGALIAHMLKKPFIYVRPKPKDHGTGSQIEGILDFERAFWGDPIADFPTAFVFTDDIRKEQAFWNAYLRISGKKEFTERDDRKYQLYRMYILTIMAAETFRYGFVYGKLQEMWAKWGIRKCLRRLEV